MAAHFGVHRRRVSSSPCTASQEKRVQSVLRLIDDVIFTKDDWRYFFLNWCEELGSAVMDELMGNQIVPVYNSNIVMHIQM